MNKLVSAKALNKILATLSDFSHLSHFMHVNTKGVNFYQDHLLYERIYNDIFHQIDRFAERVAYLGSIALVTVGAAHSDSVLPQLQLDNPELYKSQLQACAAQLHALVYSTIEMLQEYNDPVTENMLCELGELVDKFIYLLQSP